MVNIRMAYDKLRVGYRRAVVWLHHTVFFPDFIRLAVKKRWRKFGMNNGITNLYHNFNYDFPDDSCWEADKNRKRYTET